MFTFQFQSSFVKYLCFVPENSRCLSSNPGLKDVRASSSWFFSICSKRMREGRSSGAPFERRCFLPSCFFLCRFYSLSFWALTSRMCKLMRWSSFVKIFPSRGSCSFVLLCLQVLFAILLNSGLENVPTQALIELHQVNFERRSSLPSCCFVCRCHAFFFWILASRIFKHERWSSFTKSLSNSI